MTIAEEHEVTSAEEAMVENGGAHCAWLDGWTHLGNDLL